MNKEELKIIATIIIMICSACMIFARRWNNTDKDAGIGIAGWTMFIIIGMWLK